MLRLPSTPVSFILNFVYIYQELKRAFLHTGTAHYERMRDSNVLCISISFQIRNFFLLIKYKNDPLLTVIWPDIKFFIWHRQDI